MLNAQNELESSFWWLVGVTATIRNATGLMCHYISAAANRITRNQKQVTP